MRWKRIDFPKNVTLKVFWRKIRVFLNASGTHSAWIFWIFLERENNNQRP
jgi:hypothetical protein